MCEKGNGETEIRGVRVYDGAGGGPEVCSVFLKDDRISGVFAVGAVHGFHAQEVIDGTGLSLAPGFIDVHSHSDATLLAAPEAYGKLSQGVTTEIVGNCGLSVFPANGEVREHLNELYMAYNVRVDWSDFAGYRSAMERRGPGVNVMSHCGHNTLRASVLGYHDVPVTDAAIESMRATLAQMLEQGACGFSTGLLYVPGRFASPDELRQVISVMKEYPRPYATHLRSESDQLLEAVQEAVELAGAGSGILQISHLKCGGERNWNKLPEVLSLLEQARTDGLSVHADRYPYLFGQTTLSVILPPPYDRMPDAEIQQRLRTDRSAFDRLRTALNDRHKWGNIILASADGAGYPMLSGLPLLDAAAQVHMSPGMLTAELMRLDAVGTMAAFGSLSPVNLDILLEQPWVCCGSDENARPADYSLGRSHPRAFGSFPRFMRRVAKVSGWAEAVRRVTGLPASIYRIEGRGLIRAGAYADLVMFDEEKLCDHADFTHPHAASEGIHMVWVNGKKAYSPCFSGVKRHGRMLCPYL